MPIPEMKRVSIVAHAEHKEAIIETLHRLGVVDVESLRENADPGIVLEAVDTTDSERKMAEIKYALDFLYNYTKKPNVIEGFFLPRYGVEKKYYEDVVKNYDLSIVDRVRDMDQHLSELGSEQKKLELTREQLLPWRELTIPFEDLETAKTVTEVGIIRRSALEEILPSAYVCVQIVKATERNAWVAVTYLKECRGDMEVQLRAGDFQRSSLPAGLKGTPQENIGRIQEEMETNKKEKEEIETKIMNLVKERYNLMILYDYYQNVKATREVRGKFLNTQKSFVLQGWIQKKDCALLKGALPFPEVDIAFSDPQENDSVPVTLENRKLKPFEVVTRIYGLPLYREIDPTPLLTPFFIVFFALCLSDVVYGILLIGFSLFALKKIKIGPDAQLLFRVLIIGGVLTIIAGFLTGSWASDLTAYLPESLSFLDDMRMRITLFDPLKDPLLMLELALVLGLLQVWTGILIRGYLNIRDGRVLDGILDQGLWLVLLPAGTATMLNKMLGIAIPYPDLFYRLTLGAVVGLILTQGRYQKASNIVFTIVKRFLAGVLSIYSVFGYLGDVLSYSRILALGLATSALAAAFNMVAFQISGMKFIGPVIMVAVLLATHFLDFVVSALGAFVHSGRLQFVEYFTKFLEGGGRTFRPFGFQSRYIRVMEES